MKSFLLSGIIVFALVNALSFFFRATLAAGNISLPPLLYGNAWLFAITGVSFFFELKGVKEKNTQAFFRYVYTGMLLKMFLSIAVVLIYALTNRTALTPMVVVAWLVLYIGYTSIEVSKLLKVNKEKH